MRLCVCELEMEIYVDLSLFSLNSGLTHFDTLNLVAVCLH